METVPRHPTLGRQNCRTHCGYSPPTLPLKKVIPLNKNPLSALREYNQSPQPQGEGGVSMGWIRSNRTVNKVSEGQGQRAEENFL